MAAETVKKSKKPVLLLVVVALLGILAGSAITYAIFRDDINEVKQPQSAAQSEPVKQIIADSFDQKLPEGTISPGEIINNPDTYKGKEVKVRGRVVETGDNKYVLVSSEANGKGSVVLDVPNGVDIAKYVAAYSDPKKITPVESESNPTPKSVKPVTVTGTLVFEGNNLKLKATKIDS